MSLTLHFMGAMMRLTVRPVMRRATDPQKMRHHFERAARRWFRPVPHMHVIPCQFPTPGSDLHATRDALWVGAGPVMSDQVLLYLHGGGYIAGNPKTHQAMVARISRMTGLRAFVPDYRLAPEHPLPAALQDARAAHAYLLQRGYRPDQIILGGDSAGGGLALALLAELCQSGQPPATAFALSPFCDLAFTGASVQGNGRRDHFFPGDRGPYLAQMILGDLAPDDPRASPLYANFPDCPPVLIQVSDAEILYDDARRMADKLREAGTEVTLQIWQDAPHVWQIFDGWFPEARAALRDVAHFLRRFR